MNKRLATAYTLHQARSKYNLQYLVYRGMFFLSFEGLDRLDS